MDTHLHPDFSTVPLVATGVHIKASDIGAEHEKRIGWPIMKAMEERFPRGCDVQHFLRWLCSGGLGDYDAEMIYALTVMSPECEVINREDFAIISNAKTRVPGNLKRQRLFIAGELLVCGNINVDFVFARMGLICGGSVTSGEVVSGAGIKVSEGLTVGNLTCHSAVEVGGDLIASNHCRSKHGYFEVGGKIEAGASIQSRGDIRAGTTITADVISTNGRIWAGMDPIRNLKPEDKFVTVRELRGTGAVCYGTRIVKE